MATFLNEFRASAIPDHLALSNVKWVAGDEAVRILAEQAIADRQKVQYVTATAAKILKKYSFAADGGWVAYGCTIDGGTAEVPYFKAVNPRRGFKNGKLAVIKYETPQGCEAAPLVPFVDSETAQQIYSRYGIEPLEGESFWCCVWRCGLPIGVTEGLKKALSMTAHGLPTIALRGITCWRIKGTDELHSVIKSFATVGRSVYICLDQDEKFSTQIAVQKQVKKLGAAFEAEGCKTFVVSWDGELGKGIDDAIAGKGDDAQQWFDELLQDALTLKLYCKNAAKQADLRTIQKLNRLSLPAERETTGEYMPELPPLKIGAGHINLAQMNSGKTYRLKDYVQAAKKLGWLCLVLAPLNSLGQQTAKDLDLPHIHDFGTRPDEQQALWTMASQSGGIVMCPDSLHRLPDWFKSRPLLLILDEGNQVIDHMTQGNTLGNRQSEILERFSALATQAQQTGAIVLSEAGIPDRAVKFVEAVSGCHEWRLFRHHKQATPWNCTVFSGQASGYRALFLEYLGQGNRALFVTSSQAEGKRVERVLSKRFPHLKVVRIDSETNEKGVFTEFFEDSTQWLYKNRPDVLILSPSAKSGISIEGGVSAEDAYFSSVWGYFSALATDTHLQLTGRYRPPVPRYLFAPDFIQAGSDESLRNPRAIKRRIDSNARNLARAYELEDVLEAADDRAENLIKIETAVADYRAEADAVAGAQKANAHDALVMELEAAGHQVQCEKLPADKPIAEIWKAVKEEIWQEDALKIASATIEPQHDLKWAANILESIESTLENRIKARKVFWRDEFPGIDFDEPEQCYQALCKDYGAMRRGVLLQAKAENLSAAKESDRSAVEAIAKANVRAWHRMPKGYPRALLIQRLGILSLLDGQTYSNADPRVAQIKQVALHFAKEISYYFRLQIKPDQTPVEIANKLLKKLGLEAKAVARPGRRDELRDRQWAIDELHNPVRVQLLEAARRKYSGSVSTICIKQGKPHIQIMDTAQKPPISVTEEEQGRLYRWRGKLGSWRVVQVDGATAKVASIDGWNAGIRLTIDAPLAELEAI